MVSREIKERRASKGNQGGLLSSQDPQEPTGAQGTKALPDPKEHVSDCVDGEITLSATSIFLLKCVIRCTSILSAGEEFFKGSPGGRGRPGSAGFKGPKGDLQKLHFFLSISSHVFCFF